MAELDAITLASLAAELSPELDAELAEIEAEVCSSSLDSVSCGAAPRQRGRVDVILGAQWGDEGKGKLVDILSGKYAICARVAGGSNAGHTIVVDVSYSIFLYLSHLHQAFKYPV